MTRSRIPTNVPNKVWIRCFRLSLVSLIEALIFCVRAAAIDIIIELDLLYLIDEGVLHLLLLKT